MYLGLDLGTTNIKAIVAGDDGWIVSRGSAPVGLQYVANGGVEQDIEEIYASTLVAIAQAGRDADLSAVKAIGVSSQGGALQMLDGGGWPVGRVVSWLDGRGREFDEAITREVGSEALAKATGHARSIMALGQLFRLKQERPELLDPPNQIGLVGDVIVGRLCGRRAHDDTSLSCAILYNPSLRAADPGLMRRVGIGEEQLPALIPLSEPAGRLREEVARRTGLRAGIPVSAAVFDQYAAALGVSATAAGNVMFGAGTAWVLLAVSDQMMRPVSGIGLCCTHIVEGLFGQVISLSNGGSAVNWAQRLTGLEGKSGSEIDQLLQSVPPGSDGLRCWPFLATSGAGLPAETAGQLIGLKLSHGPAHVLRAVVEGLAMELTRYLGLFQREDMSPSRLVMCGGAAASQVTPQIIADMTGLPVACAVESDTAALGAAMIGRGLVEPRTPLADISRRMAPSSRVLEPGPHRGLYRKLFDEYLTSLPRTNGGGEAL